jgi:mannitol/fructose-specific phosphotransferase system IIA component (Ntr-type)
MKPKSIDGGLMIKLSKFCEDDVISFNLKGETKDSRSKMVKNKEELLKAVLEREKLVTTGVGYGIAFPHAKTRAVKGIVIAFGRKNEGVDFDAMDRKSVYLFFLIAAPEDAIGAHLNVMAKLSYLMKSEKNRQRLMKAKYKEDLIEVLDSNE